MSRLPITPEGYQRITDEVQKILTIERPQNIADIEEALSHGDLKENAEYHAAKEHQGLLEAKLQRLNEILSESEVVDTAENTGTKVAFGAYVEYEDTDTATQHSFRIVGKHEADIKENTISVASPVGRALLGKEVGDEVEIIVPKGKITVEVLSVSFTK